MGQLDGKVAIVTGAGQGIGRGVSLALAKEGAAVVLAEWNKDTCLRTAEEIRALGGRALPVPCDVSVRKQVQSVVAAAVAEFGTVDILVNVAQAMRNNIRFEDTTDDDMSLTLGTGLLATFYFMQECFPYFKERGGKIINFASAAGTEGQAGWTAYAASKEGIRAITRVACHEWGKYGININVVCPLAMSPHLEEWGETAPKVLELMKASVPLRRLGDCERDIGRAVVFLAGPDSDYITGQTLMVDGGQAMLR